MAITTVNELLTSTRKIILQVGVTENSNYTLQAALDYYLTQVNALQAENVDYEVVAKMLDRRISQVAIDEGAGRGNVYDIYSDDYVTKYGLGSSFSLAIDKVGIDGIDTKVTTAIQAKIDDGSIGTGGSSEVIPITVSYNNDDGLVYLDTVTENFDKTFIPFVNSEAGNAFTTGNSENSYLLMGDSLKYDDGANHIELFLKQDDGSLLPVFTGMFNSYRATNLRASEITYDTDASGIVYKSAYPMPDTSQVYLELYSDATGSSPIGAASFNGQLAGGGLDISSMYTLTPDTVVEVHGRTIFNHPVAGYTSPSITSVSISIPAAASIMTEFAIIDPAISTLTGTASYGVVAVDATTEYLTITLTFSTAISHSFDNVEYEIDGGSTNTATLTQTGMTAYTASMPTNPQDNSNLTVSLMYQGLAVYSFDLNRETGIDNLNSM